MTSVITGGTTDTRTINALIELTSAGGNSISYDNAGNELSGYPTQQCGGRRHLPRRMFSMQTFIPSKHRIGWFCLRDCFRWRRRKSFIVRTL